MEFFKNIEPSRKLNTKGCCFLCFKNEEINQTKDLEGNKDVQSSSIRSLLRHLQIPIAQSINGTSLVGEHFKQEDIKVDLCEICGEMINRFSVLFQNLEKIQLEMDYVLERIHKCIDHSAKAPEMVQNYSKRMTSDLETLSQLDFVDNLRKQVSKTCLEKLNVPRLQVSLTREEHELIKKENIGKMDETNGYDFSESVDSKFKVCLPELTSSPPPSPNSTEAHEEEIKLSIASDSTFTENKKLSSSLKSPAIQTDQKSKYHTKQPSSGMYKCNKCDKESKYTSTIRAHYKSVHQNLRFKCDICNIAVSTNAHNLKLHKKTCRENLEKKFAKEKDPKFKFICKICGKRFDENSKVAYHSRKVHQNANKFQCDLCDKKYKSMQMLKSHQTAIHQSRKLYCKKCNKMYKDLGAYKKHERNCAAVIKVKIEETVECEYILPE